MTSEVEWLISGRVLHYRHSGRINLEGSHATNQLAFEMASQYPDNIIHIIFDFSEVQGFDLTLSGVKASIQGAETFKNSGWMVVINSPRGALRATVNMISTVFGQLLGLKIRQFETFDRAVEYLQEVDPTLL